MEEKFDNFELQNKNDHFNDSGPDVVYIDGNDFIKGNMEDIWESHYDNENPFDFFTNDPNNKLRLATYSALPNNPPKAIAIYFHGMGGYMKISSFLAQKIKEIDVAVYGYDYRGHGKSEGKRCYFGDLEILIKDSIAFIEKVKEIHPDIPIFLGGASMGGNIAYKISLRNPGKFKGVFLFAPALKSVQNCCTYYSAVCLGSLFPCCGISTSDPKSGTKSAYSLEKIENDPYIKKGSTSFSSIKAILVGMKGVESTFPEYRENFIVFMGGNERVVNSEAIFDLVKNSPSKNKKLYHYKRMFHNVLMEEESFDVIEKIQIWIRKSLF